MLRRLANWWCVIRRRRWIILYISLAIFVSTIFFTNRQNPVYLAKATVRLEIPYSRYDLTLMEYQSGSEFGFNGAREVQLSRGLGVIEEMTRRLALEGNEGIDIVGSRALEEDEDIEIKRFEESNIVEVRAKASTPEQAAERANIVAQVYVDLSLEEKHRRIRLFRQLIERQQVILKAKLEGLKQVLENFKQREGDITLEKEMHEGKLAALESKLAELMLRYHPENSQVRELKEQIQTIRNQLDVLASKESELRSLTRNFDYYRRRYEDYRERAISAQLTEEGDMPYVSIIEPAKVPKFPVRPNKLLNGLVGALVGLVTGGIFAFLRDNLETPLRTIEEMESFMKLPVLGVIPYLAVKEEKDKPWWWLHYRNTQDRIPRLRKQLIIHYNPRSPVAESYRSLRTSIQTAALEKGAKALLFTSAGPGDGKSITAANLAIAVALAGHKVLLVDGDLRRPVLHKLFGLERGPGLTNCLTGVSKWKGVVRTISDILVKATEWEEILRAPGLDNLKLITCGQDVSNPAEILDSNETKPFIEELKANFDLILFDSPPVLLVADATILGSRLDGVILVYQTAMVARDVLRRAKEQLESVRVSVKGVVLNNTTREMEAYSPYNYYRYRYYENSPSQNSLEGC